MSKRHASVDDKWVYKGRVELVDVEVVVGSALEDERKFDVLSPEGSFVVYAASEEERDDWTSEIRSTKAQLLVSLNVTNPNSTLTSSASTNHVRRALQALPYPPSDERLATVREGENEEAVGKKEEGRALGASDLDPGWEDVELHAVWEDVWLEETEASL
ncbi:hypothetical protein NLJ89_g9353 [Agrocybe chaxingu]|uniref:PH domain-containing protein n=1 Tax=Agrocybe chaxingu TaxID=84603 RepID=A0A9W8MT70_9AGAR|nr:hypothetical protein NLJ89_g9353 [Agrocybe chaxingu]